MRDLVECHESDAKVALNRLVYVREYIYIYIYIRKCHSYDLTKEKDERSILSL